MIKLRSIGCAFVVASLFLVGCSGRTVVFKKIKGVKLQEVNRDPNIQKGCFTELSCGDGESNAAYLIKGSSAVPNFRTAFPFFVSAFKLSKEESPNLKRFDDQVWANLPTEISADAAASANLMALFQLGSAGCKDFVEKGRGNAASIANVQLNAAPASNSSAVWEAYAKLLVNRLWGDSEISVPDLTVINELRAKVTSAYPGDSKQVAFLLCTSIASAPKAWLQ